MHRVQWAGQLIIDLHSVLECSNVLSLQASRFKYHGPFVYHWGDTIGHFIPVAIFLRFQSQNRYKWTGQYQQHDSPIYFSLRLRFYLGREDRDSVTNDILIFLQLQGWDRRSESLHAICFKGEYSNYHRGMKFIAVEWPVRTSSSETR